MVSDLPLPQSTSQQMMFKMSPLTPKRHSFEDLKASKTMVIDSVTVPKERKQEAKMQSQSQNVKKVAGLD